jgi:hypothetical protein
VAESFARHDAAKEFGVGNSQMKSWNGRISAGSVALLMLTGCAASRQEVAARLGQQYIGQNVDALVVRFGPPASTFKLNSGETSYAWQLGNQTNIYANRNVGTASTEYCKVTVIASPAGIVTQLNTEDPNIYVGLTAAVGIEGSFCAARLR